MKARIIEVEASITELRELLWPSPIAVQPTVPSPVKAEPVVVPKKKFGGRQAGTTEAVRELLSKEPLTRDAIFHRLVASGKPFTLRQIDTALEGMRRTGHVLRDGKKVYSLPFVVPAPAATGS